MFIQRHSPICGPTAFGEDLERLFDNILCGDFLSGEDADHNDYRHTDCNGADETHVQAAVDIRSTKEAFTLTFDMPGVKREEIDVSLEDELLTVKGARRPEAEAERKDGDYIRRERSDGEFKRTVRVSENIEVDKISASLTDGVLTVTLPRAAEEQARRIEVVASN